jgi:hypothetical protein
MPSYTWLAEEGGVTKFRRIKPILWDLATVVIEKENKKAMIEVKYFFIGDYTMLRIL